MLIFLNLVNLHIPFLRDSLLGNTTCAGQRVIIHILTHVDSLCAAAKCGGTLRGEERGFGVHYNYDDEAQISPTICHVSERFEYKLSAELQLKRERDRQGRLCNDDDEAQIPLTICHVFMCLTISITCCQLERERGQERKREREHER